MDLLGRRWGRLPPRPAPSPGEMGLVVSAVIGDMQVAPALGMRPLVTRVHLVLSTVLAPASPGEVSRHPHAATQSLTEMGMHLWLSDEPVVKRRRS